MARLFNPLAALLLFCSACLTTARGQNLSELRGTVEDSVGVAVLAKIKLGNQATAEERSTTSDEDGYFEFDGLPLGPYLLRVEAEGFEKAEKGVEIGATPARVRIRLKLARMKQQVTVTAKPTSAPSAQQNPDYVELDQRALQNLPIKDGDPLAVPSLFLDPAVVGAHGPQIIVDGVESSTLEVPLSSIKEIYVNKSPYSAEFGRPGKGRIEIITRRGSHHHYRGLVSALLRNSDFDARNAFASTRPELQRAISEGQLSGPLARHLTFFIAGRYYLNNQAAVINAVTPTGSLIENFLVRDRNTNLYGRLDYDVKRGHRVTLAYKFKYKPKRGQNVGGFNLPERATNIFDRENEFKIFDTTTVSDNLLNEARFTFKVQSLNTDSLSSQPAIIVPGAFSAGGAQVSQRLRETVSNLQDIASFVKGRHALRFGGGIRPRFFDASDASNFGGTFNFSSLSAFVANKPFLFTQNHGNPKASFTQHEYFTFLEDEIRLRPHLSLSLGLRHEFQSNLSYYDSVAPRLALAYAPGGGRTVIRAGAGVFYDRQPEVMEQQALLYDGLRIRQTVIQSPDFPNPFDRSTPATFATPSVVKIAPGIRTPYLIQENLSVERKLGSGRNYLTVDFSSLRGVRLYRMRNINAPLPGTLITPDPNFININQFESSGTSRSYSATVTFQATVRRRFDLLAQYMLSRSTDDTSGFFSFPANTYDLRSEWGSSDLDRRHRLNLMAVYRLPFGFKTGTIVNLNSGIPFNITTGFDSDHDNVPNDRPPGLGRNTGHGPGYADVDVHLSKEFRLQSLTPTAKVELGVDAFNVFNRVNFKDFVGTLTSPYFGHANAANPARELQLSVKFRF